MFRPKRMEKIQVIAFEDYKYPLVENLHEAGVVQIEDLSDKLEKPEWASYLEKSKVGEKASEITSSLLKINRTLDTLRKASGKDQTKIEKLKSFINPEITEKTVQKENEIEEILKGSKQLLSEVKEKLDPLEENLSNLDSKKTDISAFREEVVDYLNLDIPLKYIGKGNYTTVKVGKTTEEKLKNLKKELNDLTELYILEDYKIEEKTYVFSLIYHNEKEEEITTIFRENVKERFDPPKWAKKTPKKEKQKSKKRLNDIEEEKKKTLEQIRDLKKEYEDVLIRKRELLEIEKERAEVQKLFAKTKKTILLEGWIPLKKKEEAKKIVQNSTEKFSYVEFEKPDKNEKVPVELDNPKIFKPWETLVKMFDLPGYDEIDPTPVIAIAFTLFMGLCLTDSGYGILNILLASILIKGPGKVKQVYRNLGWILLAGGGASTLVWGVLTGGFLGDFLPRLTPLPTDWAIWVNPISENAVWVLVLAIIIGVAYTATGLLLGIYQNITRGKIRKAVEEQITWLIVLLSATPLIANGLASEEFVGGVSSAASTMWGIVASVAIIISVLVLVVLAGPIALMDLTGFLGNILSYARLLALAVATGGIATVINIISIQLIPQVHPALIIVGAVIFVVGHLGNYAFQTLGAFIHSLRLQYVEFFDTFYKGSGVEFKAFKVSRKHTKSEKIGGE